MKVTVSCAGRFHAYNLASELNKHQVLEQLITTYPKSEVKKYNIPKEKIKSLVWWEVLNRAIQRSSGILRFHPAPLHPYLYAAYDSVVSKLISPNSNVFIGWSALSESGMIQAKKNGVLTILERGSSHIEMQTELLSNEFQTYSPKGNRVITNTEVIEKELREYELADYISVPSTFVKRTFLAKGIPAEKIVQNAYGVSLKQFRPGHKKDNVFRVLYVGQMSLRKGVHYLLQAFDSLQLPNAELQLVGNMTEELKPFFEKFQRNVSYVKSQPQHELIQYYQQASVFAICSIEEGMAMVQAQAMACGLPVICTTNTGGEDLIRNGVDGFVISIRNVAAIREKLEWMFEHPAEVVQMGQSALHRVSSGFTWEDYGNRYFEFLKSHA